MVGQTEEYVDIHIDGDVILPDYARMNLRFEGAGLNAAPISLEQVGADTYLIEGDERTLIENPAGAAAPTGDYLDYLAAADNVIIIGLGTDDPSGITRYAFEKLIQPHPREPEGSCRGPNRLSIDRYPVQHLVFDLYQIARVEERVHLKQCIGDFFGVRVQGVVCAQAGAFGIVQRQGTHLGLQIQARLGVSQPRSTISLWSILGDCQHPLPKLAA